MAADVARTESKVDALADELTRLRETLVIPETELTKGRYGLGPAASKVYGVERGLSIGGYGEFFLGHSIGPTSRPGDPSLERPLHRGDAYRFVLYTGYKFSDRIVMNTELELEHGGTASNAATGKQGYVALEFAYLDFLLSKYANLRTGLMLTPMGIINEMHEPTTFRGTLRPETERRIIPSTWRELGLGLFGEIPGGFTYKLYFMSGLHVGGFDQTGLRGGRQHGVEIAFEDKAAVLRLDWNFRDILTIGGSGYFGGADQDKQKVRRTRVWIAEAHALLRYRGAELTGLFAANGITGAARVDVRTPGERDPMDPGYIPDPVPKVVPKQQLGGYVTASYNVLNEVKRTTHRLAPFVRVERIDLQRRMDLGQTSDPALRSTEVIVGLDYKPMGQVVVKAEYGRRTTDGTHADLSGQIVPDGVAQEVRLGAGFIF